MKFVHLSSMVYNHEYICDQFLGKWCIRYKKVSLHSRKVWIRQIGVEANRTLWDHAQKIWLDSENELIMFIFERGETIETRDSERQVPGSRL